MRNIMRLSAIDAIILLAAIIGLMIYELTPISASLKIVCLILLSIVGIYFIVKMLKLGS